MSSKKNMSYSQAKRAKMANYRQVYFSHNPGLFGCVWFCAYCHKAIIGKQNVEVDHIVPLNNPLGMNKGFNLVAACRTCNRNKSDKFDGRVAIGYTSKFIDTLIFGVQKIVIVSFVALYVALQKMCALIGSLLLMPFKSRNWKISLAAIILYSIIIYIVIGMWRG